MLKIESRSPRSGLLSRYLVSTWPERVDPAAVAICASLDAVGAAVPDIADAIAAELRDQRCSLKLIAEIADVIHHVLGHSEPDGASRAAYVLDDAVSAGARSRVRTLLDRHPLYPEIDLALLAAPGIPA